MGSVIENEKTKEKCQIFTPDEIVKNMLDHLGYSENLFGKTILESSCGNGQFLKEIVRRYIADCQKKGLSRTKIKNGLGRDIFGIELDALQHQRCIAELNSITDSFNLKRVCWQIKQADALREPFSNTFDFVVGNPPYVSYWDLDASERSHIEDNFSVCRFGAWDYSYAFLQDGYNHLKSNGKMSYIIPNSIFKTKSGCLIRALLQPGLVMVLDYKTTNVFGKVLTSPAIIFIDRAPKSSQIIYQDLSKKKKSIVERSSLGDEWLFGYNEQTNGFKYRFGDYFNIATGVATQRNDVFVFSDCVDEGEYFSFKGKRIEKSAVKKAASPRGKAKGLLEYIIFPYYYSDSGLKHYDEAVFKNKFPFTYSYLQSNKKQLDKRDSDKNAQWFEFGRSQALAHINQNKILLSTVVTGIVRPYLLERDEVPYSGLFITVKERPDALSLTEALAVLKSPEFLQYIEQRGINVSGNSVRIIAKNIADYCW